MWEELLAQTHEESSLSATFLAFLTIACLLAAVGVATDSPVTIVGAMVVGPEFGPLAAFAVAVVRRDFQLARRSAAALAVGFPVAMVVALLAGAAGMLSLVTAKSAALVGVFISVTTVPAAGFAVVAATLGEWRVAFLSAGQLAVNMAGIVVAGIVALALRPRAGSEAGPVGRLKQGIGTRARIGG